MKKASKTKVNKTVDNPEQLETLQEEIKTQQPQNEVLQKVAQPETQEEVEFDIPFDYSKYVEHPLITNYPKMSDDEFLAFTEDVRLHGLIDPIIITRNNEIIDGRIRFEACRIADVIPHFDFYDDSEENIHFYWISKNYQRNHLSSSQKACLSTEVQGYYAELIKIGKSVKISKRRKGIPLTEEELKKTCTRNIIGKLFRVNSTYCDIAKNLRQYEPEVFNEVKAGNKNLTQAEEILKRNVDYILNVILKDKYKILKKSKLELTDSDFELIEAEKQKGHNLISFIGELIDNKLDSTKVKYSIIGKTVQKQTHSGYGDVEDTDSETEDDESDEISNVYNFIEHPNSSDTYEPEENEDELINEFDTVDKDVKIRIVKLAHEVLCSPSDYLLQLINKAAA